MRHPAMLERKRAALAVIDMQEAFRSMIADFGELAARIGLLAEGAALLGVPVIVTEQYPKGLGRTVAEVAAKLPVGIEPIEKLVFSACGAPDFDLRLRERHIEQVVVCGIEAHICVSQTAHDLIALGYQVHIPTDAIASRLPHNRDAAVEKLARSGAVISTIEMALFELCGAAGTPEFKSVQNLVKTLR
jgi:nicotinamidase-related amidase